MPKFDGVYQDTKGRWYFKVWLGRDPISGRQSQVTKRGFSTAADAVRARRELLSDFDVGRRTTAAPASLTVDDLLDVYLDGLDADERLARKTRFDYRANADAYVRPWLGSRGPSSAGKNDPTRTFGNAQLNVPGRCRQQPGP
jgi:hypothetical protein